MVGQSRLGIACYLVWFFASYAFIWSWYIVILVFLDFRWYGTEIFIDNVRENWILFYDGFGSFYFLLSHWYSTISSFWNPPFDWTKPPKSCGLILNCSFDHYRKVGLRKNIDRCSLESLNKPVRAENELCNIFVYYNCYINVFGSLICKIWQQSGKETTLLCGIWNW